MTEKAVEHLEALREDIRDEIKKRIEQRDRYSIQLTISLGVIVGAAFSQPGLSRVIIAAPLVSIYFTVLILYSYRVHKVAAAYLHDKIEPALADLLGTSVDLEWERFYAGKNVQGIRRRFFFSALWVVCIVSMGYLLLTEASQPDFIGIVIVSTVIYGLVVLAITKSFWKG